MVANSFSPKIILIDIDGCLNTYPDCFIEWVNKKYLTSYVNIKTFKKSLITYLYELIKEDYRNCGAKRDIPIQEGAKEVIDILSEGNTIIIITNRPNRFPINRDTRYWLIKNKIRFDLLIFLEDKYRFVETKNTKIKLIIEDDEKLVNSLSDCNIPIFFFSDKKSLNENVITVKNWKEISYLLSHIK